MRQVVEIRKESEKYVAVMVADTRGGFEVGAATVDSEGNAKLTLIKVKGESPHCVGEVRIGG